MIFNELTEENLMLYAAKAYYKPNFSDIEEFYEDLKRFKYIKRLVNRYLDHEELAERLILNHLIVIFNSFGIEPELTIKLAKLKLRFFEVPISYNGRSYDEGKKIGLLDAFKATYCIVKYKLF